MKNSRTINPIALDMDKETKKCIESIVNQLKKYNYAITSNGKAVREFSKRIPIFYRRNNIIIFSRSKSLKNNKVKSIIAIKPEYCVESNDSCTFKLKMTF